MCVLSPERIVIGGGVAHHAGLLDLVRRDVLALMNGYLEANAVWDEIADYITLPGLGTQAGVLGAIALAETALVERSLEGVARSSAFGIARPALFA